MAVAALAATTAAKPDTATALLLAAGNAPTERERFAHLRSLAARVDTGIVTLDAATRRELVHFLPTADAWANGRSHAALALARGEGEAHRYLHGFFDTPVRSGTQVLPKPMRTQSPLYPLWAFYRARMLTWVMFEHSSVGSVPERKRAFIEEAERCFAIARTAFPENPLLKIYSGENLPASELSLVDERAPEWANHQRRALEQLHRIIRWWIAERQLDNGEFGGNWGDDVEMWRWWAPVLIGFDDPVVTTAQERLARGNLARPGMAAGYTSHLTDVEHTSEETADTLTPMLHASGPTPEWAPRIRRLLELADKTWWGENVRGRLQFKHIDFNHERLGTNAGRAYDTGYHTRLMQPVLLLWQRTRDPALGAPLTRWLRTWAEAALSTDNDKPAGIVPAALQWPSGRVGSVERGWIGPHLASDPMIGTYSWPAHPVTAMTASLLQAHIQTGDAIFLEPLIKMAELRRAHLAAGGKDGPVGSPAWAAQRLPQIINDPLAKWRQLTGSNRFDDLLRADANGYVRFILDGSDAPLRREIGATAATLSVNWPLFTDEVRYTDRVLSFPHAWPRASASGLTRVDTALVYSMVTGDPGSVEYFPLNGARWHTLPRELAVMVTENRVDRFSATLFHFGAGERALAVSLLTLDPGAYAWTLTSEDKRELSKGKVAITTSERKLPFVLPSRATVKLSVVRLR